MAYKLKKEIIEAYTDPSKPGSFSGVNKFREENFPHVTLDVIESALSSLDSYTRHKSYRRRFQRRKTQTSGIDKQWQADLVDMQYYVRYKGNGGYKYILMAVDVFSRYGFAQPVKSKKAEHMIEAFEKMIRHRKPQFLQTDKGMEFRSTKFQEFLKHNKITFFTSESDAIKCALVERLNRTIQDKLYRIFTYQHSGSWVHRLQDVMASYNKTKHSTMNLAPSDVNNSNSDRLHFHLYDKLPKKQIMKNWSKTGKSNANTLKINDLVRLLESKVTFNRGYEPNWTEEVFRIYKIDAKGIYIKDLKGSPISGRYYKEELQKVKVPRNKQFNVEKILKERGVGHKREALVKWKGYSEEFNSWEPMRNIKNVVLPDST